MGQHFHCYSLLGHVPPACGNDWKTGLVGTERRTSTLLLSEFGTSWNESKRPSIQCVNLAQTSDFLLPPGIMGRWLTKRVACG